MVFQTLPVLVRHSHLQLIDFLMMLLTISLRMSRALEVSKRRVPLLGIRPANRTFLKQAVDQKILPDSGGIIAFYQISEFILSNRVTLHNFELKTILSSILILIYMK